MALVLKKVVKGSMWVLYENNDPRSEIYPDSSPVFLAAFLCMYWSIVKYIGPKLMEDRKPFEIRKLLLVYNIVQIVVNISFIYKHPYAYRTIFDTCIPMDYSRSREGLYTLIGCRHFYWLKMFDCLETVFFVLRKSYRQVSFLHLYHHSAMVLATWVAVRYIGGGQSTIVAALNVIVHAVMFFYYLLTGIDSSWKTSITFKRSLTQMQMIQFVFIIFSFGRVLLISDCNFPKLASYLMLTQTTFMLALFADFYRKNYISKSKKE